MQIRREKSPLAQPLSACSGTGVFVGYASLFGARDASGDMVMPGAFAASLKIRGVENIRMLFQHDPAEPVGAWLEMIENERGLYVRGRLDRNVQRGRELLSLLECRGLDGLSIGFKTVNATRDRFTHTRQLIRIDLWEVSLVTFPMLEGARVSGRMMTAQIGPSGVDTSLQPHSGTNAVSKWQPAGNSTTITAVGDAGLTATGTATAANVATTNRHTYMKRLEHLVTVAATTAVAGFRGTAAKWGVGGAAAGDGGFHFICRFGPATGVGTTTHRLFVGMSNATAAPTDVEPSSIVNSVGVGYDAADTNMQIMHRGAGAVTKIDLGASFPVPTADRTKVYELVMFSKPGTTQEVGYEVMDLATGAVASGTITINLPTTATLLAPRGWMSVGGTLSVIGIALMGLYIESDY